MQFLGEQTTGNKCSAPEEHGQNKTDVNTRIDCLFRHAGGWGNGVGSFMARDDARGIDRDAMT